VGEGEKIRIMLAAMGWLLWVLVLGITKGRKKTLEVMWQNSCRRWGHGECNLSKH